MAASAGTAVSSGNDDTGFSFLDKLGETTIKGFDKWIDVELSTDSRNMPDQNDLVHGVNTSKNTVGYNTGFTPQMLIMGGVFLLITAVVIKKVL